jgi:hypothetical protein
MATLTGPYSFETYLQNVNEPIVKDIWFSLIKANSLFTYFPIETYASQKKKAKRITQDLPVPTFVEIGQEPTSPFLQPVEDYEEYCTITRDNFDFDRLYISDDNYVKSDMTAIQVEAYQRALAYTLNNYLINNNRINPSGPGLGDPNGFIGLKWRLANPNFAGNNPACSIQATASLATANYSTSNAGKIWNNVQLVLDHMGWGEGDGVTMIANPQFLRQMDTLAAISSPAAGFKIVADTYDRKIRMFGKVRIISCGYLAPNNTTGVQTTPVIDSAQDVNGWSAGDPLYAGSGNYTTAYFVHEGPEDFTLWQMQDPWMEKERISGQRKWRIMLDGSYGIWNPNTRAIARLYGVLTDGSTND